MNAIIEQNNNIQNINKETEEKKYLHEMETFLKWDIASRLYEVEWWVITGLCGN